MSVGDSRAQELIQADLDGELSAAERAELARLLLQDPAARRLQDQLRRTHLLLLEVPQAEPPASLRPAIHKALGLPAGAAVLREKSSERRSYRLAAGILGGLVVAGIGYGLLEDRLDASRGLQGSVTAGMPDRPPVAGTSIRAGEAEVVAKLYRAGTGLRLELRSMSPVPVEVVASYDAATMRPRHDGDGALSERAGELRLDLAAGGQSRSVDFSGAAPIRLELRLAGQPAATATLGLGESR
jgi:anti-sigma factor RsiW